ncbi:amino acid adenylation domain-containing protein [Gottfriedia acidiceleris]|uniref:amino acid adenylation domain-containing protein n=1 Tax=Gottfriedia acidiceleris TaxID=371036 RepID=UPI002F266133
MEISRLIIEKYGTLHEIFEEQAKCNPDRVALIDGDVHITYKNLNNKANQLAHTIKEYLPVGNELIGIFMEKNMDSIVAMLAISKAGHAYVPLDTTYPNERIEYIIENSNIQFVVSNGVNKHHPSLKDISVIDSLDDLSGISENPSWYSDENRLAYVIYTSGTTGKPKGVMITHQNIVGLMRSTKDLFDFKESDIWSIFHSYCFDFSVWEIYGALLYGGCGVIIPTMDSKDTMKTIEIIRNHKVTVLNQVPSSFYNLDQADRVISRGLETVRYVIFGGEGLKPQKLANFHERYPEAKLINMFGITEITVHGTFKEITEEEIQTNLSNIGYPLPGLRMELLDLQEHKPVPIGEIGEIVVSGYGISKGYVNRPDLTREKFRDLYEDGEFHYFSGDLGRKNKDGEIFYVGRCDNQVKIRGFRVELSEIEVALMKIDGIVDSVVLMSQDDDGNDELFAFVVAEKKFTATDLRRELNGNIPYYMMPYYFIAVDNIPLTANGKYNRRLLLDRKNEKLPVQTSVMMRPETEIEKKVASYLSELLHKDVTNLMDNFFELGGDSLKAAKLINYLRECGYKLSFDDLFDSDTLVDVIHKAIKDNASVNKVEETADEYIKSSLVETRMFSVSSSSKSKAYNITIPLTLKGNLDHKRLETAINKALDNHEVFRYRYIMKDTELIKVLDSLEKIDLQPYSISMSSFLSSYDSYVKAFSPEDYPLYDVKLFAHENKQYTLLLNLHHIMFDGISLEVFLDEVFELYKDDNYFINKEADYRNYVENEKEYLKSDEYKRNKAFWGEIIKIPEEIEEVTRDYPRNQTRTYNGETIYHSMSISLKMRMKEVCKKLRVSPFMFTQGVFHILLSRLLGTEEILTGTITSGRTDTKFEKSVGMFVNTLPVYSKPNSQKSIGDYFKEVRKTSIGLFENQRYPFEHIVKDFDIPYSKDRNPMFDYMFVYQNFRENKKIHLSDDLEAVFDHIRKEANFSKFDISLEFVDYSDGILLRLNYDNSLYKRNRMEQFMRLYENTFCSVIENINLAIKDIEILTLEDKTVLLQDFNHTYLDIQEDERCLSQYVSDKLKSSPNRKAIVCEKDSLTFKEVDEISNYYAKMLNEMGVRKNDLVGIYLPRSISLYVAMVSTIKSGAGFILIDPTLPKDRIDFILNDSGCSILITEESMKENRFNQTCLVLPTIKEKLGISTESYFIPGDHDDLSYVIYTSGTTGRPKGVKLRGQSTVNMCDFLFKTFQIKNSAHLTVSAVTFDMFVVDFFTSIAMESTFVLPTDEERIDNGLLSNLMKKEKVETMLVTPTRLDSMLETYPENIKALKVILCGGEALAPSTVAKLKEISKCTLFNFYGPSETTGYCTGSEIMDSSNITIGKPAAFSKIYIVDSYGRLLPQGYEGELWVGGKSVGKGYIGREVLNREKFIDNPYHEGTIYKTGDQAIFREDGKIVYKGRRDHQVKLHGYRIELKEIENTILSIDKVTSANVHLGTTLNHDQELRGFVSGEVCLDEVEKTLNEKLPYYMVPKLLKVDEIPMTRNGKVDVDSLNEIFNKEYLKKEHQLVQAETELEQVLLDTYKVVLRKADLGVTDHFFYNGGDSIKAIQLVSLLRKAGVKVTVSQIMNHPEIRSLASLVVFEEDTKVEKVRIETGLVPLTPIQKFYFEKNKLNDENFHQSMIIQCTEKIDREMAEQAFEKLIQQHGALRTHYFTEDGQVKAECKPYQFGTFRLDVYHGLLDETEEALRKVDKFNQEKISITDGKLLNVSLLHHQNQDYLVIGIHHIAIDGISQRILLRDFIEAYKKGLEGREAELPEADTILMWSKYWSDLDFEKSFNEEIPYWKEMMEKVRLIPQPFRETNTFATKEETLTLSKEKTEKLISGLHEKFGTKVQDLLIAAFSLTFKASETDHFHMYMEGHGREMEGTGLDITNTVGWFTTLYPVVFTLNKEKDLGYVIREIKDTISKIPSNGISYGVLKYLTSDELKEKIGINFDSRVGYAFNYMGEMKSESDGDFIIMDKNEDFDVSDKVNIGIGLTYNLTIINERLKISAIYNESLIDVESVIEGLKRYENQLTEILSFIELSNEENVPSAGDFEASNLSNDELDELLQYMETI